MGDEPTVSLLTQCGRIRQSTGQLTVPISGQSSTSRTIGPVCEGFPSKAGPINFKRTRRGLLSFVNTEPAVVHGSEYFGLYGLWHLDLFAHYVCPRRQGNLFGQLRTRPSRRRQLSQFDFSNPLSPQQLGQSLRFLIGQQIPTFATTWGLSKFFWRGRKFVCTDEVSRHDSVE